MSMDINADILNTFSKKKMKIEGTSFDSKLAEYNQRPIARNFQ